MGLRSLLSEIADGLSEARGAWAVIGGVALSLRGAPRTTFDLDLLVAEEALPLLDDILDRLDYRLEHRWEETSHWGAPEEGGSPIDAVHARRAGTRAMLERAAPVDTGGGVLVPVVDVPDLIGLKVQAMANDPDRERGDLADVAAVLRAAGPRGVDLDRVREYFELFGRSDRLEELLRELGWR